MAETPVQPSRGGGLSIPRSLLTGFVALFPLILTILVIAILWQFILEPVSGPIGDIVITAAERSGELEFPEPDDRPPWVNWSARIVAVLLLLVVLYFLGLILNTFLGKQLLRWGDGLMLRIPLINTIYPHAKQVSTFIFGEHQVQRFHRVVAIEYPRKGAFAVGFATSSGPGCIARHVRGETVSVFVPTSPTPVTGWTVVVRTEEVIDLDLTIDEALRFTVSCGVLVPSEYPPPELPPADEEQGAS